MKFAYAPFVLFVLLYIPTYCLADDKAQVLLVESKLLKIDSHFQSVTKTIDSKLDKYCPNINDVTCLKKNSNVFINLYDSAYEESIKSSNKCYDVNESLAKISISSSTKQQLSYIIAVFALKYGTGGDVFSFAQEAFEQLQKGNFAEFKNNLALSSSKIAGVKENHDKAMLLLSKLNASLGIPSAQK